MNNWGVDTLNSSSINRASEIYDISFAWIIVNSHELLFHVQLKIESDKSMGTLETEDGGWCFSEPTPALAFQFRSPLCTCLEQLLFLTHS